VLLESSTQVGSSTGVTGTTAQITRDDNQSPAPGQQYSAKIRATAPGYVSDWLTGTLVILGAPVLTQVSYDAGDVNAQWTAPVGGATLYEIELDQTVTGGTTFTTEVGSAGPAHPVPTAAQISMAGRPRWNYTAKIKAYGTGTSSDWSSPVTVQVTDPPAGLAVGFNGTSVTATWQQITGLIRYYILAITAPDGTGPSWNVGPIPNANQPPPGAMTLPDGQVVSGTDYAMTVATFNGFAASAPSPRCISPSRSRPPA
jgi:hypothetical protein